MEQEKKDNLETTWGPFVKPDMVHLKGCCNARDTFVAHENCQICFVSFLKQAYKIPEPYSAS